MLEIICLGALALTTDFCPSKVSFVTPNATENITTTEVHLAGRHYESDYSREADKIKERQDNWNHRNSRSGQNRIYREIDRRDGGCVDESGRIHRDPDGECIEENNGIYLDFERGDRDSERYYPQRRDRIHRNPDDR